MHVNLFEWFPSFQGIFSCLLDKSWIFGEWTGTIFINILVNGVIIEFPIFSLAD